MGILVFVGKKAADLCVVGCPQSPPTGYQERPLSYTVTHLTVLRHCLVLPQEQGSLQLRITGDPAKNKPGKKKKAVPFPEEQRYAKAAESSQQRGESYGKMG